MRNYLLLSNIEAIKCFNQKITFDSTKDYKRSEVITWFKTNSSKVKVLNLYLNTATLMEKGRIFYPYPLSVITIHIGRDTRNIEVFKVISRNKSLKICNIKISGEERQNIKNNLLMDSFNYSCKLNFEFDDKSLGPIFLFKLYNHKSLNSFLVMPYGLSIKYCTVPRQYRNFGPVRTGFYNVGPRIRRKLSSMLENIAKNSNFLIKCDSKHNKSPKQIMTYDNMLKEAWFTLNLRIERKFAKFNSR